MRYLITIFFILCSLVFAQSNIDEDSIHFIGQASAFTVGANLTVNGTFDADSDWTRGGGWTIGSGIATCDGTDDTSLLEEVATLTSGTIYRVTFDITTYNSGTLSVRTDGMGDINLFTSAGSKTVYMQSLGTILVFRSAVSFNGSIDNVETVVWVGDLDAAGGTTIASFTGTLTDYMTATGGVLQHGSSLSLADDGGNLQVTGIDWDTVEPKVGTLVNMDFSAALDTIDDGIFEIITVTATTITIDGDSNGFSGKTVEMWVGGAYPDIATAINDSTLSQDPGGGTGQYRKRYICVNVPMEVDAVTDFVAETSETALREDDGSRKIIGFYDSISVVNPGAGGGSYGYRVVSDMDFGQTYYAGARKAFNQDESFPVIRPNGKWIEWNAKGNSINILELNTSNFEMRNIKIHNTAIGGTNALLDIDDAIVYNLAFINCWFSTADDLILQDAEMADSVFLDCYFSASIIEKDIVDFFACTFINCIGNGTGRNEIFGDLTSQNNWYGCLFYKGGTGLVMRDGTFVYGCTFFGQTVRCLDISGAVYRGVVINSIFSPVAVSDVAIGMRSSGGSLNAASHNNIMYSVTGGGVLTNPIVHDQISPNPPLPVGTIEKDPLFVNPAIGDFRLRVNSPGLNAGYGGGTIGWWQPYAAPFAPYRPRHSGPLIYR